MSYDLPKPIEFEVGDIVRPREGARYLTRHLDCVVVEGSPTLRVIDVGPGIGGDLVYVMRPGIDLDGLGDDRWVFDARDLVKVPVVAPKKSWPVFPVGCLVRVRAEWGPAYSTATRWCLVYSEHVANEVIGSFVPGNGTEPTITLSIDHGRAQQVFRVSAFERVYLDTHGKLRPFPVAETIDAWPVAETIDGFVVVKKQAPVELTARTIREKTKMLSYGWPSPQFSTDALREHAKATGATLPLELESHEPVNDWSTGFDENWDDHAPRKRE